MTGRIVMVMVVLALGRSPAIADDGSAFVARLKGQYLACDREATLRVLAVDEAQACSAIGDTLLKRVFDGDFDRLLAWWRSARQERSGARDRAAPPVPSP